MAVKVAINGFGRIGRLAFRQMFEAEGYEVVAINDLTSPKMLAHLLKYDTAQGSFLGKIGENKHTVEATEDSIIVDGKEIKIYAIKDAKDCPWGEIGVDVVLECTGFYTSKEKSMAHIAAGAKKVVISAPAGNDLKTIVYSVNEKTLTKDDQVISAASCTTNCLAPMADTLNKTFPIVSGIMTTVHAYTGDQMILDGPQRKGDLRRADAIFIEELRKADLYDKVSQAFTVFLPVRSVGVMGDGRKYDWVVSLRAVETIDFMTAHWAHLPYDFLGRVSNRIINEVNGISRVVYDISGKPPATIEWE